MFIGREKEIAELNQLYQQNRFQLFAGFTDAVKQEAEVSRDVMLISLKQILRN